MRIEWIVSSSGLILLVLLVRLCCRKKMPPRLRYALWLVAALRLLLPFSVSETTVSILNLLPDRTALEKEEESKAKESSYEKSGEAKDGEWEFAALPDGELDSGTEGIAIAADKEGAAPGKKLDAGRILRLFWLLGTAVFGTIFTAVNLDYGRRLKRSRRRVPPESLPAASEIPVYETQTVQTPCLFGLLRPAVYVTEGMEKEETTFRFVLYHENTHYRQRDHLWALVRILCLSLHWFNPLVWLAACLSRQDGELACDERTLNMLGDKARVHYGKALLKLSTEPVSGINGWRISTTMSGSARQMKERLRMIVNTPGRTAGIQLLLAVVVILSSVITFTGKSSAQEKRNPEALQMGRRSEQTEVYMNNVSAEGMSRAYGTSLSTDEKEKWIAENVIDSGERKATIYYQYDEKDQIHMVKYVEENHSPDAVLPRLELTYVEDDSPYTLPAIADETELHRTMISMAVQSLEELCQWTGERVEAVCFQITDMGDVYFGLTPEDVQHSRIFFSRAFGWDTIYNLSNYEKSISSMYLLSGRSVWYSPVLWRAIPDRMEKMTDEEIIIWYLERNPMAKDRRVKSIEKSYEDTWTIQTEDGAWFDVVYDADLEEAVMVSGPYPEQPIH